MTAPPRPAAVILGLKELRKKGLTPRGILFVALDPRGETYIAVPEDLDAVANVRVGDKLSLIVVPIVAACGGRVFKTSGRALGHSGGTIDKLEAIPGFRVDLPMSDCLEVLNAVGCVFVGQTADIAPADKKLYALRDVTATIESVPLISASVMSKKLAEGSQALVLDVQCGRGAFMKTLDDARALARSIVRVGRLADKKVSAVLTRMDAPLGRAIGNALETAEALAVLPAASLKQAITVRIPSAESVSESEPWKPV